jgi:hypothetical protein
MPFRHVEQFRGFGNEADATLFSVMFFAAGVDGWIFRSKPATNSGRFLPPQQVKIPVVTCHFGPESLAGNGRNSVC